MKAKPGERRRRKCGNAGTSGLRLSLQPGGGTWAGGSWLRGAHCTRVCSQLPRHRTCTLCSSGAVLSWQELRPQFFTLVVSRVNLWGSLED